MWSAVSFKLIHLGANTKYSSPSDLIKSLQNWAHSVLCRSEPWLRRQSVCFILIHGTRRHFFLLLSFWKVIPISVQWVQLSYWFLLCTFNDHMFSHLQTSAGPLRLSLTCLSLARGGAVSTAVTYTQSLCQLTWYFTHFLNSSLY